MATGRSPSWKRWVDLTEDHSIPHHVGGRGLLRKLLGVTEEETEDEDEEGDEPES